MYFWLLLQIYSSDLRLYVFVVQGHKRDISVFLPVEPVSKVGQVCPLHSGLVQWPQQATAGQGQQRGRQRQPFLRARTHSQLRRRGERRPFLGTRGKQMPLVLFLISMPLFPEVLPADVLEDGQAQRVEQEVPDLVFLLYEAAGSQTESVTHCTDQQQSVQLRQCPVRNLEREREGLHISLVSNWVCLLHRQLPSKAAY